VKTLNTDDPSLATGETLQAENEELRLRLAEAEETIEAIRSGAVDALVVTEPTGHRIYTLEGAERPYRLFVEEMQQGAATLHLDGTIAWCNRQLANLLVMPQEKLIGAALHDFIAPKSRAIYDNLLWQGQTRSGRGEAQLQRTDNGLVPVFLTFNALPKDCGAAIGVLITDLTTQRHHEQLEKTVSERTAELRETIGELEAFSYSISHDMRAPLRAMQGYAQALLEDYRDRLDSNAQQYLDRIVRGSHRLDSLIQEVLAYSRVAKDEIILGSVDLEHLLQEILQNHPEFQPPRARIAVDKPLHRVFGHEAYLTQCFTNLLGNAVKFVAAGKTPEIRIRTEQIGDRVRLWVEDNGIGIDPSHYERIFQIFGQVYPATKYGGTGIGLSIVRKAIQRMNGQAGVESKLGQGSRFWLTLKEAKRDDESSDPAG
jgi:signal transduction histidine kinase